jgi:putative tryptophan/tyrosine transport system substrate-binding protein
MYSYADRPRAMRLHIKLGKRLGLTVRQFGYLNGCYFNEYLVIRRRLLVASLSTLVVTGDARAQQRKADRRIGLLFAASPPLVAPRVESFRAGLAALGYAEDKGVTLEPRYAYGDLARLPALATELVKMPVDVIVTGGSAATGPAIKAQSTIPIVMAQDNDPVGSRFVSSLARPGGNVTGLSTLAPELSAKQLALLTEILPGLARVAVIGDSAEAGNAQSIAEAQRAAARLGIHAEYLDVRTVGDLAQLFEAVGRGRAGAALVLASGYLFSRQDELSLLH